jgi:hypothetical protein
VIYRKIDPRMWNDDKFLSLQTETKMLWVYLLTGPHVLPLPGIFVAGVGTLSDGMRNRYETVSKGLAELSGKGMVEVDAARLVMRIPNACRYNPPDNPNVLKGWWKLWGALPECPLKYRHVPAIQACLPDAEALQKVWTTTFGTVDLTVRQTVSEPFGDAFRTHEHEQQHEHEHDHQQEQQPEPAADAPVAGIQAPLFATEQTAPKSKRPKKAPAAPSGDTLLVWEHFRSKVSPTSVCTPGRVFLIEKALASYSAADLMRSIDGYAVSPHHNGQNATGTKYLSLELFFRNAEKIEAGWGITGKAAPMASPHQSGSNLAEKHAPAKIAKEMDEWNARKEARRIREAAMRGEVTT